MVKIVLNLSSGKYLSDKWTQSREKALRDIDSRETLTDFEKDFLELSDTQIGSQDPSRTFKEIVTGDGKIKKIKNKNYSGD